MIVFQTIFSTFENRIKSKFTNIHKNLRFKSKQIQKGVYTNLDTVFLTFFFLDLFFPFFFSLFPPLFLFLSFSSSSSSLLLLLFFLFFFSFSFFFFFFLSLTFFLFSFFSLFSRSLSLFMFFFFSELLHREASPPLIFFIKIWSLQSVVAPPGRIAHWSDFTVFIMINHRGI
ncbi:hypothetical protein ACOSQ2_033069 [Xanthoceras sorbifolium]